MELAEIDEPTKKKRRVIVRAVKPIIGTQFRAADVTDVKQVGVTVKMMS